MRDLGYTLLVAMVMVIALTFSIQGIELFKSALIDFDLVEELNPDANTGIMPFQDIFLDTISLAFLADGNSIENLNTLLDLLDDENISRYPTLQLALQKLSIYKQMMQMLQLVIIFCYIIILLNFIIAVMSDTYSRVAENQLKQTQHLKAQILLEQAWFTELRISCMHKADCQILPWKIFINTEEEKAEDDWEGQMNELKKHTVSTVNPVNFSINILNRLNGGIGKTVDEMVVENKQMTEKVETLITENQYLKECLDKIMNKLNA